MKYRVHVSSPAADLFNKLPEQVRVDLYPHLVALAEDPYPPNSKALTANLRGLRSLRVGDYRAVYSVDAKSHLVDIRGVGHRRGFYRLILRLQQEAE